MALRGTLAASSWDELGIAQVNPTRRDGHC